jgi:malate dehydrogenase
VAQVSHLAIWGNHSGTQYPDAWHAQIDGRPAPEVIGDDTWLRDTFIPSVQQRGNAILTARGVSSAGSAANAILDSVRAIHAGTPPSDWTSLAVISQGEYGVPEGLVCSFPVASTGSSWQVVEGIAHDEEAQRRITASVDELIAERQQVQEFGLLPSA